MRAAGIGRVIASKSKKIVVGDLVCHFVLSATSSPRESG